MPLRTYGKDARRQNMGVSSCKDDGSCVCSLPSFKATRERSSVLTPLKRVGASSPSANQFQALRDILENYPNSESCSLVSASPCYHSVVPNSPSGDVQLQGPSTRNHVRHWILYTRRKVLRKGNATIDEGNDSLKRSNCVMAMEEGLQHVGQDV